MKKSTLLVSIVAVSLLVVGCKKKGPDGVPECEEAFKLAQSCAGPAAEAMKENVNTWKEAWKEVDQDTLKATCKQQVDMLKSNPGCKK